MRAAGLALAVVLALPSTAHAYKILRTVQGAEVRWKTAVLAFDIDPAAPPRTIPRADALEALGRAVDAWARLEDLGMELRPGPPPEGGRRAVVRFRSSGWRFGAQRLANTDFAAHAETGEAREAYIEVNEQHHRFALPAPGDRPEPGTVDLTSVLVHEVGHVLGLDHSQDATAAMYELNHQARTIVPGDDDRAGIAAIYGGRPRPAVAPRGWTRPAPPAPPAPPAAAAPPSAAATCTRALPEGRGDHRAYVIGPCPVIESENRLQREHDRRREARRPRGERRP